MGMKRWGHEVPDMGVSDATGLSALTAFYKSALPQASALCCVPGWDHTLGVRAVGAEGWWD